MCIWLHKFCGCYIFCTFLYSVEYFCIYILDIQKELDLPKALVVWKCTNTIATFQEPQSQSTWILRGTEVDWCCQTLKCHHQLVERQTDGRIRVASSRLFSTTLSLFLRVWMMLFSLVKNFATFLTFLLFGSVQSMEEFSFKLSHHFDNFISVMLIEKEMLRYQFF